MLVHDMQGAPEGTPHRPWLASLGAMVAAIAMAGCNSILGNSDHHEQQDSVFDAAARDSATTDAPSAADAAKADARASSEAGGAASAPDGGSEAGHEAGAPACTPGDQRCSPSAPTVQQCDLQGIWRDTTTCPFACGGSGTTTACTGSCLPGTKSCGPNNTPEVCDSTGTNQPQTPCANLCDNGVCTGTCAPNATRCVPGSTTQFETCDLTGNWGAPASCTYVCDPALNACGGECVPGAPNRCSGNAVQTCDATGHWTTSMTCSGVPCSQGACQACTAGAKQCNAGTPQTCSAALVWTNDQASACPFLCDPTSGACTGQCVPGTDACTAGPGTQHCDATGHYGAPTACPSICDSTTGKCAGVCVPGAQQCNGSASEVCNTSGQWGAPMSCSFGCNTTTGACNACTDEPMATTCAGGKCGSTMNNCGHAVACAATCSGTGQTCGGGGVAGVCGCKPEAAAAACGKNNCGTAPDGCGGMVNCGSLAGACPSGQVCGSNGMCAASCTPLTSCPSGKNCGTIDNGCGTGTLTCGTMNGACPSGDTCSSTNVCTCSPMSASAACGKNDCGTAPNGCGGLVNCGSLGGACPSGQVCGTNGMCAASCTPLTSCPSPKDCGTIDNGCGTGTLTCGTMNGACPGNVACGGGNPGAPNVCCKPVGCPSGQNCGMASDGCGNTISCGTCAAPQTCGGGGQTNVCGWTPALLGSSLVTWLDGSKGVLADGSGNVTAWGDQSTFGNNAVPGSCAAPHLTSGVLDGRPTVTFNGTTSCLTLADAASLQWGTGDFALYVVARYANAAVVLAPSSIATFWSKRVNVLPTFDGFAFWGNTIQGSTPLEAALNQTVPNVVDSTAMGFNDDHFHRFGALRTGTTLTIRADGAAVGSGAVDVVDVSQAGTPVTIGLNVNGASFLQGDIAELIAVQGTLNAAAIAQLESYLQSKYGL